MVHLVWRLNGSVYSLAWQIKLRKKGNIASFNAHFESLNLIKAKILVLEVTYFAFFKAFYVNKFKFKNENICSNRRKFDFNIFLTVGIFV